MFVYCTNNPINFQDPIGLCKNTFSIYFKVDCGESDCPTSHYYIESEGWRKTTDTLELFVRCLDISAGVGTGLYLEGELLDIIGLQAGSYTNLLEYRIHDGQVEWGDSMHNEIAATLLFTSFGAYEDLYQPFNGEEVYDYDTLLYSDETLTIVSVAVYPALIGGSCNVSFDSNRFFTELRHIF